METLIVCRGVPLTLCSFLCMRYFWTTFFLRFLSQGQDSPLRTNSQKWRPLFASLLCNAHAPWEQAVTVIYKQYDLHDHWVHWISRQRNYREFTEKQLKYVFTQEIYLHPVKVLKIKGCIRIAAGCCDNILAFVTNVGDIIPPWLYYIGDCSLEGIRALVVLCDPDRKWWWNMLLQKNTWKN